MDYKCTASQSMRRLIPFFETLALRNPETDVIHSGEILLSKGSN